MQMENKELLIAKSNPILNMKNDFDLYQQRMLNLYLAKINPLDDSSRRVSISLAQFVELLGIKKVNVKKLQALANKALDLRVDLCRVGIDDEGKKREMVQMDIISVWERFKVYSKDGVWTIDLLASGSIMPYLFQVKDLGYLNFSVLLALRMRSPIAEKLYEQCARFKDRGVFTITLEHLRERLGISEKKSYESYNRLKTGVLQRCMKEINENTDIYVSIASEKRERRRGAPVSSVTFSVKKNTKYREDAADIKLRNLYSDEEKNIVEMKPFEVEAGQQVDLIQLLRQEYGLTDSEAKIVIQDQKKLGLSDDRVMEVVKYSIEQKPEEPIRYIRTMLKLKDADLRIISEEEKARGKQGIGNQFNQFEQNKYDFNRLEKELIDGNHFGKTAEDVPDNIAVGAEVQEEIKEVPYKSEKEPKKGLPLYYIVLGRSDTQDRLAAYASKGITEITILSEEDYNRLK